MIETARLTLRAWRDEDIAPFAAICADPLVMTHLGGPQPLAEVEAAIARHRLMQDELGHSFWAVERREDGALIGFCGLKAPGVAGTPVERDVEIGWRLRVDTWGQGYAREAAEASLAWGWAHLPVDRIIAITVPANRASWSLMERLGMERRADHDFAHPAFPADHSLSRHIVYAAQRSGGSAAG